MTPEDLARSGSEHGEQAALFCWAQQKIKENPLRYLPLIWMFAIPNGGERHAAVAGKLKAEGVKSGVADIFLPWPTNDERGHMFSGLFIEMKPRDSGSASDNQKRFIAAMLDAGYQAVLCHGYLQAIEAIEQYLG